MRTYEISRGTLRAVQFAALELKLYALVERLERGSWLERRYAPNQPRVPARNSDGGQWTDGGGAGPGDLRVAQLSDFTKHGVDQSINRGISPEAILDAIRNPRKIRPRPNGTTQYIGSKATVVLNDDGFVITVWGQ